MVPLLITINGKEFETIEIPNVELVTGQEICDLIRHKYPQWFEGVVIRKFRVDRNKGKINFQVLEESKIKACKSGDRDGQPILRVSND